MMYKALISFTGKISMAMGDIREISDVALAKDLLRAGYVMDVSKETPDKVTEKKPKSPRRKEKKDGN